ncbi:Amidase signature domain protein [Pleurostoma richardsiae]|uniref:Amidase signature domain protein n=1 Tax=Pleurostoma richardsiae TaxID=41990 RepID=A0AA38RSZ1_9PEZI|nr:Amidase signature domain protein [Pleurostoma richardsiae]
MVALNSPFLLVKLCLVATFVVGTFASSVAKRSVWTKISVTPSGDVSYTLGNNTYLANLGHPKVTLRTGCRSSDPNNLVPFTVISVNETTVTGQLLEDTVNSYITGDDVFTTDYLEGVYITFRGVGSPSMDNTALNYLASLGSSYYLMDAAFNESMSSSCSTLAVTFVPTPDAPDFLPAGPYAVTVRASSIKFNTVYRLYEEFDRDFLYGTYDANDGQGTYKSVDLFYTGRWFPYIPVPSRIYSWSDPRPLSGSRVAIKDLFDLKGLITSGGSQAWALVTTSANATAPSIQRIIDLGGIIVGKYKLAQFASGANPWDWQDEHYPWNPRGDGYLTCSASSSGGGCSIASYDWLDFAIGSDTGSSMRRPGAVSGTYANRPSQGMMTLEGVMPLSQSMDTAGVFARDIKEWVHFAKNWYIPELHQDPSNNGLAPLDTPDTYAFPKRVLYLTDYLPMANPAAEAVLQAFLANMSSVFDITTEEVSFASLVNTSSPDLSTLEATLDSGAQQWREVGKPLVDAWAERFDGRFPPIDQSHRFWQNKTITDAFTDEHFQSGLVTRRAGVDWFEQNVLFTTNESCSESIMIYDIGTGGLPSFREQDLVANNPAASYLAQTPARAVIGGATICPLYGCVDMTIPIGQVTYQSNVTFHSEYMPVTVSVIAKRGCDFMLWNMWEKLAENGVLKTVKTGRTAF